MALNPQTLANQLKTAFDNAQKNSSGGQDTLPQLCNDLATAIDTFVKSATVTTQVTGTASGGVCTPSGPVAGATVTGTGIGSPGSGIS